MVAAALQERRVADDAVPKGFKQTEIGLIPEDWEVVMLGELLDFKNGYNAPKAAYGHGVPFANVLEVITNSHLSCAQIPGRVAVNAASLSTFGLQSGDILFNRTSETDDEVALASRYRGDEPAVFGGFVLRGRQRSDRLNSDYAAYAWREAGVRSRIIAKGQGAVRANVGQGQLRTVPVPLPPLPEQEAIAGALADADGAVRAVERLIEKKRAVKQAALHALLTPTTRLPSFDGDWETKTVSDVCSVKTGPFGAQLHERDYVAVGTPIVTVEHLGEYGIDVSSGVPKVSDSDRSRLSDYQLKTGDIVFSRVGSVDRNALVRPENEGWLFSGRLLRVRPKPEVIHSNYLSYFFRTHEFIRDVYAAAVGQTMASLNTVILSGIKFRHPPLDEQRAIAAILSDMDAEIAALEARRDKLKAVKQGMMQSLLTGKVRLV